MHSFIDYVHNYREVDEHSRPISIWSFVAINFWNISFDIDPAFHV